MQWKVEIIEIRCSQNDHLNSKASIFDSFVFLVSETAITILEVADR